METELYKCQYDNRGAAENGRRAEKGFVKTTKGKGYKIRTSTIDENMFGHIDFHVKLTDGSIFSVDVKAIKSIKTGWDLQDEWLWLEFLNVHGHDGWLYGKSEYMAFETFTSFVLCPRIEVQKLAEELIDIEDFAGKTEWAKYRVYRRPGRKDKIGMIQYSDLESITHEVWVK